MLFDRMISIGIGRTGHAMLCLHVLPKIPGLVVLDERGHTPFQYYKDRCKELNVPLPPAFTFIRNPFEWYVSHWCWTHLIGTFFKGTFPEYMEKTRTHHHHFGFRSVTMTWAYHGAENATYIGRYENLYADAARIISTIIPDLTTEAQVLEIAQNAPWQGKGRFTREGGEHHGDYRQYYDDTCKQIVHDLDGDLIERFGYTF